MSEQLPSRVDLATKLHEVIVKSTADPAEDLKAMGKALIACGEALEGQSASDARNILAAVQKLL